MNEIKVQDLIYKLNNEHSHVLFVTNRSSFKENQFDKKLMSDLKIKFDHFIDFSINPKLTEVIDSIKKYDFSSIDAIVGVGGGSAMDMAKSIHYFTALDSKFAFNSEAVYLEYIQNPVKIKTDRMLTLIPTTSGSGSEATHFSVLYHNNSKFSLAHSSIYPNNIILDADFTKNLPASITAYTGFDAIAHALESFWAKDSNTESRNFALKALKLLVPNIICTVKNPTIELRQKMLMGSYYAGRAIDITKTTAAHAFSYYLTTFHNVPHGHAVSIMMPYFIEANAKVVNLEAVYEIFDVNNAIELREKFYSMMVASDLQPKLSYYITNLDKFINGVNLQRLKNNPYQFKKEDFKPLFSKSF